jgi:hypothetical protein
MQLLWKMQLQLHYIPLKLRLHVRVPEKPGEFHAQKAAERHQEGGGPHQVLAREAEHLYNGHILWPNLYE